MQIKKGFKKPLELNDVWDVAMRDSPERSAEEFWNVYVKQEKKSVYKALYWANWKPFSQSGWFLFFSCSLIKD